MDVNAAFEAEMPRLRRYALKLTRDRGAADELVQECLARGLGKLSLWQEGSNLQAWLFTIMHNLYVNDIRRAVKEGSVIPISNVEPPMSYPPPQDKALQLRDVSRALKELTAGQREAIFRIGLDGWTYQQVAEASGRPVGTIRSRLHRGRRKLSIAA